MNVMAMEKISAFLPLHLNWMGQNGQFSFEWSKMVNLAFDGITEVFDLLCNVNNGGVKS